MPKIIGLTGGIGSGKSRVATVFEFFNVPCYLADREAKRLMSTDLEIKAAVIELFGENAYDGGILNRAFIGNIVFTQPEKLKALNAIVHPAVAKDFTAWLGKQACSYVIKEAAILFETGGYKQVDCTVLITAPQAIRIKRVMERDGSTEEEIIAKMNNQWRDEQRIPLADYVIENIDWEQTKKEVERLHQKFVQL